jgi:phage replication-related protein YjqB (UPF0714/DUF867 family)
MAGHPAGGPRYDYWTFEGLRASGNAGLHVTSTNCDDAVAISLCAGALNAVSLHGCTAAALGLPGTARAVLVGGRSGPLKGALTAALDPGFEVVDGADHDSINGDDPANIANRTLLGAGAHLELTKPLRDAMFTDNTRAGRATSTTQVFWDFVAACRSAIAATEADQPIL